MLHIEKGCTQEIDNYAEIYMQAYACEPWNEVYNLSQVREYIGQYIAAQSRGCFILKEQGVPIGLALCLLIPSIGDSYMRIEDFCIAPCAQRSGAGTAFMELVKFEARSLGCDSILLGTQQGFPSHHFYLKNGFQEIESSVLLYCELPSDCAVKP